MDSHPTVNSKYEILTKQCRLYEKCMTSRSELTSQEDKPGLGEWIKQVCICVCAGVCLWSPGGSKTPLTHIPQHGYYIIQRENHKQREPVSLLVYTFSSHSEDLCLNHTVTPPNSDSHWIQFNIRCKITLQRHHINLVCVTLSQEDILSNFTFLSANNIFYRICEPLS